MVKVEKRTDLELVDYLENNRSRLEIERDLHAWFREALSLSSLYSAYFVDGDYQDADGNSILSMIENAKEKSRNSVRYRRVEAESEGVFEMLPLFENMDSGDVLLLSSPPGSVEEGFGDNGMRLSMMNVGVAKRMSDGRKKVYMFTIPSPEKSLREHYDFLYDSLSLEHVNQFSGNLEDLSDRDFVSSPILVRGGVSSGLLEKASRWMGRQSLKEVVDEVNHGYEVLQDKYAIGRRNALIVAASEMIMDVRRAGDRQRLKLLGDVIRSVLALESGGNYLGVKPMEMVDRFVEIVQGYVREYYSKRKDYFKPDVLYDPEFEPLRMLQVQLLASEHAQMVLGGSSCGGGGLGLLDSKFGVGRENFLRNQSNIMLSFMDQDGDVSSNKEDYSFDKKGKCVVCDENKMVGPCGICEKCDHAIRAKASLYE